MTDLERKVERYQKKIPRKEVSEAFKVFKLTGDEDIRENLMNMFGKNNIGYWHLIEQILILENILNE